MRVKLIVIGLPILAGVLFVLLASGLNKGHNSVTTVKQGGLSISCKELQPEEHITQNEKKLSNLFHGNDHAVYSIKISNENGSDIFKDYETRKEQRDELIHYLEYKIIQDINGTTQTGTIKPVHVHYNKMAGLSPDLTLVLIFPKTTTGIEGITFFPSMLFEKTIKIDLQNT